LDAEKINLPKIRFFSHSFAIVSGFPVLRIFHIFAQKYGLLQTLGDGKTGGKTGTLTNILKAAILAVLARGVFPSELVREKIRDSACFSV
jgi:hypothetical protein